MNFRKLTATCLLDVEQGPIRSRRWRLTCCGPRQWKKMAIERSLAVTIDTNQQPGNPT